LAKGDKRICLIRNRTAYYNTKGNNVLGQGLPLTEATRRQEQCLIMRSPLHANCSVYRSHTYEYPLSLANAHRLQNTTCNTVQLPVSLLRPSA